MIRGMQAFAVAAALALGVLPAAAQSVRDQVIAQIAEQGYTRVEVSRTWLGRLRFIAYAGGRRREIVIEPNTGEVLRDVVRVMTDGERDNVPSLLNRNEAGRDARAGPGKADSGDDDRDSDNGGGHGGGGDDDSGDDDSGDGGGSDDGGGGNDDDGGGDDDGDDD